MLARALQKHGLEQIWEDQYRPKNGPRGVSADEFFGMTPHQLFRSFFKARPDPTAPVPEIDQIAFLRKINQHQVSIGNRPQTPAWLMKEVPRG